MTSESLALSQSEYQAGKDAFERGDYRKAVQSLERSLALIEPGSQLGGEVQIWLVTAYEAATLRSEAIALCRQVSRHPDYKIRQQGKRLLYILEAPLLRTRPEWLTEIPDLSKLPDNGSDDNPGVSKFAPVTPRKRPEKPRPVIPEPVDLSQVNTQNRFIWVALAATGLILGSLIWLN
ncbi:MAG: hypothetical protein HC780_20300 [Leptolyngbyaceae cyanobacterium CSU_1_3]|nr:hypothetical protein [Leptolyngbyaceae cyanobacterium CSU_1_3]